MTCEADNALDFLYRMASEELEKSEGTVKAGGSGMDLIFNKLEGLQQEIKDEQAEDDKWILAQRAKALQSGNDYLTAIKTAENKVTANDLVRHTPFPTPFAYPSPTRRSHYSRFISHDTGQRSRSDVHR